MDEYVYAVLWLDAGTPNAGLYRSRDEVLADYGQSGPFQNGLDEQRVLAAEGSPGDAVAFGDDLTLRYLAVQP